MNENTPTAGPIVPAQPQRAAVAIGQRGLNPGDLDGLWRVAQYVAKSGLAPKGVDTPEAIFVAMEMGLELGLPVMASLQNIAVVNGRPTLWGDSQLAVVRATGELEEFAEWYEAKGQRLKRNPTEFGDDVTAVCKVKRRGLEAAETAFSMADARRAGLLDKPGPWKQYPARMLRFRARSFALRDQFGDALRGLLSTEEAQDVVAVTPTAPAVTVKAPIFRAKPEAPALTLEVPETPPEDGDLGPQPETAPVEVVSPVSPAHQAIAEGLRGASLTFEDFREWARSEGWGFAKDLDAIHDIPERESVKLAKAIGSVVSKIQAGKGAA